MHLVSGSAQHIGGRQQQQDAFGFGANATPAFARHAGTLSVVADGMGGMANGDQAAKAALAAFLDAYQTKPDHESIPDALLRALHTANQSVYDLAVKLGAAEEMGTTLIATVIHNNHLYWISSGDSAIFLYRDAEFTQLNQPHVFAVELEDQACQGNIPIEVAKNHPEREALTSFIGMERISHIDRTLRPFTLKERDIVLLATDGLFKTLSLDEMGALMKLPIPQLAEKLVATTIAVKRPYQDNVTVIAIACNPAATAPLPIAGPLRGARSVILLAVAAAALLSAGYFYLSKPVAPAATLEPAPPALPANPPPQSPLQLEEKKQ